MSDFRYKPSRDLKHNYMIPCESDVDANGHETEVVMYLENSIFLNIGNYIKVKSSDLHRTR